MAKTSGKTSSNPRGRRPAAGGAKRKAPSPLTTLFGGLKDLMKVNFDNRFVTVWITRPHPHPHRAGAGGVHPLRLLSTHHLPLLWGERPEPHLCRSRWRGRSRAGTRGQEYLRPAWGTSRRLPIQPALRLGDRLRTLLRRLPLCTPHLAPPYRALPLHHQLPRQWLPPALGLRSSSGPAVALPLG